MKKGTQSKQDFYEFDFEWIVMVIRKTLKPQHETIYFVKKGTI